LRLKDTAISALGDDTNENNMNFRQLLDTVRFNGPPDHPPRTWEEMGDLLSVSVAHLHSLMGGRRSAPTWTIARIATRLGRTELEVRNALEKSQVESENP